MIRGMLSDPSILRAWAFILRDPPASGLLSPSLEQAQPENPRTCPRFPPFAYFPPTVSLRSTAPTPPALSRASLTKAFIRSSSLRASHTLNRPCRLLRTQPELVQVLIPSHKCSLHHPPPQAPDHRSSRPIPSTKKIRVNPQHPCSPRANVVSANIRPPFSPIFLPPYSPTTNRYDHRPEYVIRST